MTARPTAPATLLSDAAVLERIADELAGKFVGVFSAETVYRYVFESHVALRRIARIRLHLVPLTARFAADRLTALAKPKEL